MVVLALVFVLCLIAVVVLSLSLLKKTQILPHRLGVILGSAHFCLALGWSVLTALIHRPEVSGLDSLQEHVTNE